VPAAPVVELVAAHPHLDRVTVDVEAAEVDVGRAGLKLTSRAARRLAVVAAAAGLVELHDHVLPPQRQPFVIVSG